MNFEPSEKVKDLQRRVSASMHQYVYPNEERYEREVCDGDRWQPIALIRTCCSAKGAASRLLKGVSAPVVSTTACA